ncbi:hypothetical protein K474DRAFT_1710540 [Panus rudis PR-1116 ss-1]|nr:hypothetical protein K474DRAFT_1710540 [Panus rudis PR-1116 ss-1]
MGDDALPPGNFRLWSLQAGVRSNLLRAAQIFGRAIKNEYLALGTLIGTAVLAISATGGSKKEASAPSGVKQTVEQVKESVKFDASSKDEEELFNSIKKFIADAEKEGSKH